MYIDQNNPNNRATALHNLFSLDMSMFNKLVIKNDLVKIATPFFVFMEEIQLPHDQVLVLEDRTLQLKVLSKLYRVEPFGYKFFSRLNRHALTKTITLTLPLT